MRVHEAMCVRWAKRARVALSADDAQDVAAHVAAMREMLACLVDAPVSGMSPWSLRPGPQPEPVDEPAPAIAEVPDGPPWQWSVRAFAEAVQSGRIDAHAVLTEHQHQLDVLDRRLGLFITRRAPLTTNPGGRVAGVPYGLKDSIMTRELPTTAGASLPLPNATLDAEVRRRLDADGAELLGKLTLDAFGMGSSGEYTSGPVALNPWSLEHLAGGSSSGSAAAVAARAVGFSIGTDTGGSIRLPAAFCGIVGIKPTQGTTPPGGVFPFAPSLEQAGPLTRTVRDAALVLEVMTSRREGWLAACEGGLAGVRIGIERSGLPASVEPEVAQAFMTAIDRCASLGAEIVMIERHHTPLVVPCYFALALPQAVHSLARVGADPVARSHGLGPEIVRRLVAGVMLAEGEDGLALHERALRVRTLVADEQARAWSCCDVLASPTTATTAFRRGGTVSPLKMYTADAFLMAANLAGAPALSVPCGWSSAGLPIGLHLSAAPFDERSLFRVAAAYEDATQFHRRLPPTIEGLR